VHGGVRYLEKAVFNLDQSQLKLVFEALAERKTMLDNAPHLTRALPIMTVHCGSDFFLFAFRSDQCLESCSAR
jgi:glycerol-3-phosphate dehydrogenase